MLSAVAIAGAVASKKASAVEVVQQALERAEAVEPVLQAFVSLDADRALAEASERDRALASGATPGAMQGVPFVVKDVIDVAGQPTRLGSPAFDGARPAREDASVVRRLRQAGGVFLGKVRTHELAMGVVTPPTANPYNTQYVVGGSSGGAAAVVAAGVSPMAVGTDTGGSIRIPAAICGVLGVKPTAGRVSRHGVWSNSWTLDVVGLITPSTSDAALGLAAIVGADDRDPASVGSQIRNYASELPMGIRGLRVVRIPSFFEKRLADDVSSALETVTITLRNAGVEVGSAALPSSEYWDDLQHVIQIAEVSAYHAETLRGRAELLGPAVRSVLEVGQLVLAGDYLRALQGREVVRADWARLFRETDAVLAPTTAGSAVTHGTDEVEWADGVREPLWSVYSRLTAPANLAGLPAVAVPAGLNSGGMPVGVQFIGPADSEPTLLSLAAYVEHAHPMPGPPLTRKRASPR